VHTDVVFERFTDQACRVVVMAQEEARGLGHGQIGSEHLLLGVLVVGGIASDALGSLGASLRDARREVAKQDTPPALPGAADRFADEAKQAMADALGEARGLGRDTVTSEYLLLALCARRDNSAVRVLDALDVRPSDVRLAVLDQLENGDEIPTSDDADRDARLGGRVIPGQASLRLAAGSATNVPAWPGLGGGGPRRCSFCGRRESSVEHLVRAREVYICEHCVALAHQAISEVPASQKLVRIRPRPGRPSDPDSAEMAVEEAFETVFGTDASFEERCAAISGGANLVPAMQEASDRFTAQAGLDVSVEHVRFLSEEEAEVSFVLLFPLSGISRMPEIGHALLVDGQWKVARETYCGLVNRIGVQCPPPPA
jgi:hypothetical protein